MNRERFAEDAPERQLRRARAELDRSLRAGDGGAERWLAEYPELAADDDLAVELIYSEYLTREELGQRLPPEEWFGRFPQFADRLRRLFQVDEWLGTSAADEAKTVPRCSDDGPPPDRIGPYELLGVLG